MISNMSCRSVIQDYTILGQKLIVTSRINISHLVVDCYMNKDLITDLEKKCYVQDTEWLNSSMPNNVHISSIFNHKRKKINAKKLLLKINTFFKPINNFRNTLDISFQNF